MCLRKCNKPCDKFTLATCLDRIRTVKELEAYKNLCPKCNKPMIKARVLGINKQYCTTCNPILQIIQRGIS